MKRISVRFPPELVRGMEELIKQGKYSTVSEIVRKAVEELLRRELWNTYG